MKRVERVVNAPKPGGGRHASQSGGKGWCCAIVERGSITQLCTGHTYLALFFLQLQNAPADEKTQYCPLHLDHQSIYRNFLPGHRTTILYVP